MEDFNSDERFLVPDSEDDDLNSREPWDLISGLEALSSQKRYVQEEYVNDSQIMSTSHKQKSGVLSFLESSESAEEGHLKKTTLAYDTVSSDIESGESHNQTVIERKVAPGKRVMEKETSTPSEHIGSLQFSQEDILVPETLDSVGDDGTSPSITHTAPFIVPDSPSQDDSDKEQMDDEVSFKPMSSSMASQSSNKIDSQGLHLHFSQSQPESSETQGSLEQADATLGDKGVVTTPIKDPTMTLSCRKLSLKDAPPSPRQGESLPRPSFHLPSKLLLASEDNEDAESIRSEKETENAMKRPSDLQDKLVRSKMKQPKKQQLFMDTEEEASTKGNRFSKRYQDDQEESVEKDDEGKKQFQTDASLVLTEDPESLMVDDNHTISYDHDEDHTGMESTLKDERSHEKTTILTDHDKSKEGSQSQAEFDGFEEDIEGVTESTVAHHGSLKGNEDGNEQEKPSTSHLSKEAEENSPIAPSSQVKLAECKEMIAEGNDKGLAEENPSAIHAASEVSILTESHQTDPYHFQGSQTQNFADVSNQIQSDKSKSLEKSGNKTKVVKVMRKVFKKKVPSKKDQKSSSTDDAGPYRPVKSPASRRKMSVVKHGPRKIKTRVEQESAKGSSSKTQDLEPSEGFTTLQSRLSVEIPLTQASTISHFISSEMPPPMTRGDLSRRSAHVTAETPPQEINKLSRKGTTVSFQDDQVSKRKSIDKDMPEYTNGEIERKTIREVRAIVVERETTIDIIDDKGKILKQTVTKEVIRTPVEPPWLAMDVQVTERILSPDVSPSRSVSTLTSGDLADVSSSSLSRSISSGSKGSNPSLDFCSQSYPTPAQRSHPMESGSNKLGPSEAGNEANPLSKASTTTTFSSSVSAKTDNKRLSSGSNTGQDMFGSPDESLIPHLDGGHFNRPLSSYNNTPVNDNNQEVASSIGGQVEVTHDKDRTHEKKRSTADYEENEKNNNNLHKRLPEDENTVMEGMDEERNLWGNVSSDKQEVAKDNPPLPRGRGKRKITERAGQTEPRLGKKARREAEKAVQQRKEGEGVEASGSSVSTGFVVQDTALSEHTSPHDKATSSRSKENSKQIPVEKAAITHVNDPPLVDIKSKLIVGEQVMGKWTDGFYYPGVIKKLESSNNRYQLKFDDGTQRWVGPEGLLLAKELPVGQSVMVMRDDGYYECGMIMVHSWDTDEEEEAEKRLIYHVERDDGITQKCLRKDLLLSEDQAACLVSDQNLTLPHDIATTTATKIGDISLDNLVEGKRQHRAKVEKLGGGDSVTSGKKLTKTIAAEETPTPTTSHEEVRSGRKRKIGPVATSTPTPKLPSKASHVVTPVKSRTTDTLGCVVPSPTVARKSPRKTRQGLFGQKLKPPPSLFKGLVFLLTHIDKSEEQRKEEKCLLGDSSLEDTSFDENPEESEEPHPFIKAQLQSLITAGGGKVLDKYDVEEIIKVGVSNCYLVSAEHQRTVKYLQALAGNLTVVSHEWILHSVDQGRLLGLKAFLLPAGISVEKKKLMECKGVCTQLIGQTMLIVSSRNEFIEAWASILSLAKCHVTTRFPARASKADPGIDFVVSDTTCPAAIVRKCRNLEVPLVSSEWVAQCLINNSIVDPLSHVKYQHDYGTQ